jgi:hypothetical protein
MTTELSVQPPFRDEWTSITIAGEHAEEIVNILVSRLLAMDYEVQVRDEDGEMIDYEEFEHE